MNFNFLYQGLKKELTIIEKELQSAIKTNESKTISEAAKHLLDAGGKRIRPLFVYLCASFSDKRHLDQVKYAAAAIELIHMASIVHDDVVDDADTRRNRPTIKAKWGNHIAMYTGDFLFAKSLEYMANIKDTQAHQLLSRVTVELSIGEIEQIRDKYHFNQSVRDYLRRIKRKTALLIAASCGVGGMVSGLPPSLNEKLYRFGYYIGMNFQINDDILDFTADEKTLGKPSGGDLLQGNITLPVFFAMEEPSLNEWIRSVKPNLDPTEMQSLIEAIKLSGAIEKSREVAQRYLQKADIILDEFEQINEIKPLKRIMKALDKRAY